MLCWRHVLEEVRFKSRQSYSTIERALILIQKDCSGKGLGMSTRRDLSLRATKPPLVVRPEHRIEQIIRSNPISGHLALAYHDLTLHPMPFHKSEHEL